MVCPMSILILNSTLPCLTHSRRLAPLNLCPNLFGEKAKFAKYHADLFHAVAEASEHARGEQEVSLLKNVFTTIAVSVGQILEVSDDQTEGVLAFQLRKLQGAPLLLWSTDLDTYRVTQLVV